MEKTLRKKQYSLTPGTLNVLESAPTPTTNLSYSTGYWVFGVSTELQMTCFLVKSIEVAEDKCKSPASSKPQFRIGSTIELRLKINIFIKLKQIKTGIPMCQRLC
jgi:hypothetical protein